MTLRDNCNVLTGLLRCIPSLKTFQYWQAGNVDTGIESAFSGDGFMGAFDRLRNSLKKFGAVSESVYILPWSEKERPLRSFVRFKRLERISCSTF